MLPTSCNDLCIAINVSDVGCPCICVFLLWLMNKSALTYGRVEYSQVGRDLGRDHVDPMRGHVAAEVEVHQKFPLGHSHMVIQRLIEMG